MNFLRKCVLYLVGTLILGAAFSGCIDNNMSTVSAESGTQATVFMDMTAEEAAAKIGKLCQADMENSNILASVSAAQFILESGYGKSELAQNANNCFGMKCSLSGNTWSGSTWDGTSKYTIQTGEEYTTGSYTTVTADFRKYKSVEQSVADHSAYLLGAMNGSSKRYAGLAGEKDYKKAIQIIKDGGYATSSSYVTNVCSIIEKYNLTQYDVGKDPKKTSSNKSDKTTQKTKKTSEKQKKGKMTDKNCPFLVRVETDDLDIREGAGTDSDKTGKETGVGNFTIVKVKSGKGSAKGWGKLKSGAGWISLDHVTYVKKVK